MVMYGKIRRVAKGILRSLLAAVNAIDEEDQYGKGGPGIRDAQ
jgi:hypothetical protein